jgi:hypothetical protein
MAREGWGVILIEPTLARRATALVAVTLFLAAWPAVNCAVKLAARLEGGGK